MSPKLSPATFVNFLSIFEVLIFYAIKVIFQADLHVNIGLTHFNVSYSMLKTSSSKASTMKIEFQEKFEFAQDQVKIFTLVFVNF